MWAIFQAIKRSWSQHFIEQFSAFLVMATSYGALLFIACALINIESMFDRWGQVNKVSIYLKTNTALSEQNSVKNYLASKSLVQKVALVSPEESAQNFGQKFSKVSSQKFNAKRVAKFFPAYFVVNLNQTKAYKSGFGALDQFVEEIKGNFESIQNVSYGKSWLQRYISILASVNRFGWFLIFAFWLAALIMAASVIKTNLYTRREEIEVMEFIGADDKSIYLPQIVNSILLSASAFVVSYGIVFLFFNQFRGAGASFVGLSTGNSLSFISPLMSAGLFISAVVGIGVYSTYTIFTLLPRRKKALLVNEVIR